jgi:protein-tyrosine phosphatase
MHSTINFRDFGGAPSRHGGHVRRDRLYRCGHLAAVSQDDIASLLDLDFALVADLRYARERQTDQSPWPPAYASRMLFHDGARSSEAPHIELLKWIRANSGSMQDRAIGIYRRLPFSRHYRPLFGTILTRLSATDGRLLVHCTAGKDRTGIVSALILHALGVPREAITTDFMRSRGSPDLLAMMARTERELAAELGAERARDLAATMYDVDESYLLASFAAMEAECGSIDAYIESLGVDAACMEGLHARLLA